MSSESASASVSSGRRCARPVCSVTAVAVLTYDYNTRTAWLDYPDSDFEGGWHLCGQHADRLSVPMGWEAVDRRTPVVPLRPHQAYAV